MIGGGLADVFLIGSLASLAQAMIGDIPARHIFSFLQSAAMGGYGVFPVETAVRGIAAAAIAGEFWSGMRIANAGACPGVGPGRDHEGGEDRKVCPSKSRLKSTLHMGSYSGNSAPSEPICLPKAA